MMKKLQVLMISLCVLLVFMLFFRNSIPQSGLLLWGTSAVLLMTTGIFAYRKMRSQG